MARMVSGDGGAGLGAADRRNMFVKLRQRQLGLIKGGTLERSVQDLAFESITLSRHKEIDSCHRSTVLDLDLDLPESKFLLSAGAFGQIGLYNLCAEDRRGWCGASQGYRATLLRQFHQLGAREAVLPTVTRVQWYPFDSGMFFSGSVDGHVTLWQPEANASVFSWELDESATVNDLHLSPISAHCLVAAACGPTIRMCDLRTQSSTHQLFGHASTVMAVRWSPSDEYLLSTGSKDQTIRLWDIRRPGPMLLLDKDNTHSAATGAAALSGGLPQMPVIASRGRTELQGSSFLSHDAAINHLEFSPDGEFLISSDTGGQLCRWDVRTGRNTRVRFPQMERLLRQPKHPLSVRRRFALSSCGRFLFMPDADQIVVLRTETGAAIKTLNGHLRSVRCIATSKHNQDVYSGAADRAILVWSQPASRSANSRVQGGGFLRRSRRQRVSWLAVVMQLAGQPTSAFA